MLVIHNLSSDSSIKDTCSNLDLEFLNNWPIQPPQCFVYSVKYTILYSMHILLFSMQSVQRSVQCSVYTFQCAVCIVQCPILSVQRAGVSLRKEKRKTGKDTLLQYLYTAHCV